MGLLLILAGFLSLQLATAANDSDCLEYLYQIEMSTYRSFEKTVCKGEIYSLGHQFEKFWKECSIEPTEQLLPYEDSVWTFYKCIAEKSLVGKPLTLTNYAEMMTNNMSETTKFAILSYLKQNVNETSFSDLPINGSSNCAKDPNLEEIKNYWNSYFDAEMSACLDTPNNTCAESNMTQAYLHPSRFFWAPVEHCDVDIVPKYRNSNIAYSPLNETQECFNFLTKETSSFTNNTNVYFNVQFLLCEEIAAGKFELANLDKLLDFETIYYKDMVPEFLSQYVKQSVFNATREVFANKYYNYNETILASESVKDIVSYAVQHLEKKWKDEGMTTEIRLLWTNAHIIETFQNDVMWKANPCFMKPKSNFKHEMNYNTLYDI